MAAHDFTACRIAARANLLDALTVTSRRHGATAVHLLGSLGRQTADAFSDIDAWLTFPDNQIDRVVQQRQALYGQVGDLLLAHEVAGNRPVGGIYTLALYQSQFGPLQVDWYLAPQQTSRVAPEAATLFEDVPVPRGEWQLDHEATTEWNCRESVSWLIAMLFIAIKKLVRGDDVSFLRFLAEAYDEVQEQRGLERQPVTEPTSLVAISQMLRQLASHTDEEQRRALEAVQYFARDLMSKNAVRF